MRPEQIGRADDLRKQLPVRQRRVARLARAFGQHRQCGPIGMQVRRGLEEIEQIAGRDQRIVRPLLQRLDIGDGFDRLREPRCDLR
ncbi:hypothetical protein AB7M71_011097 [Bradyrhizobium japonicum]